MKLVMKTIQQLLIEKKLSWSKRNNYYDDKSNKWY